MLNQAFEYSKSKNEDVIFVTFNYDLLLEYSLRKVYPDNGKSSGDLLLEEYTKFPLKIYKMHGSCNWFRKIKPGFIKGRDFGPANFIYRNQPLYDELKSFLEDDVIVRNDSTRIFGNFGDEIEHFFPELLIPFRSKDSFILPEFQKKSLEENISKVDSILIIGWKGNEESFLELMKEKLKDKSIEIFSVNGENVQIQDNLRKHLPKASFTLFSSNYEVPPNLGNSIYEEYTIPSMIAVKTNYRFKKGGFSSYMLRTEKKMEQSFFKI